MKTKLVTLFMSVHLAAFAQAVPAQGAATDRASPGCTLDHSAMANANMDHAPHMAALNAGAKALPTMPGQATYGAIAEVVRLLTADPTTDWSRGNIQPLRQHLIDMDDVTMHALVKQQNILGGTSLDVTGTGRTVAAIQRMVTNHTRMLDQGLDCHTVVAPSTAGVRLTVTATNAPDARTVAQIRGLGFAGLLTEGDHHAAHHIALARGVTDPHGR